MPSSRRSRIDPQNVTTVHVLTAEFIKRKDHSWQMSRSKRDQLQFRTLNIALSSRVTTAACEIDSPNNRCIYILSECCLISCFMLTACRIWSSIRWVFDLWNLLRPIDSCVHHCLTKLYYSKVVLPIAKLSDLRYLPLVASQRVIREVSYPYASITYW